MKALNLLISSVCTLTLLLGTGCKNKSPNAALSSIDFLRGDIILCSGASFGEVNFALSCSETTKADFNLGISLLHSFEYDEAEKAFIKVIDVDPNCVMAYWGAAMSLHNHPKFGPSKAGYEKASKILKITESLPKTERERAYLEALNAYFENDWKLTNHLERSLKMEVKMEEIYAKYRDDKEAAIFYALSLFATSNQKDKAFVKQRKAGEILESIFPNQPNHPGIAHYIIHHYDHPELAQMALTTARRYADIAPGSAHAQHMPSHIFTRLGLWDESIESNISSAASAQCYAGETGMDGVWHNEIHAMDYLVYAYLQQGDNERAIAQLEQWKAIKKESPSHSSPYNFGAIPIRIILENRQWDKAAALKYHTTEHQWGQFPWESALIHFARTIGASRTGNINLAEKELTVLQSLHQKLIDKEDMYRADQVLVQIKVSQGWIHLAKGNPEKAVLFMKEATDLEEKTGKHPITPGELLPASELLGDLLLVLNRPKEALKAYEIDLAGHPNRFNGIYGAGMAAEQSGNHKKALSYYKQLIELTKVSNSNRPEVKEALKYIQQS